MKKETSTHHTFLGTKTYEQFACDNAQEALNASADFKWARFGDRWFHNGFEVKKDQNGHWVQA